MLPQSLGGRKAESLSGELGAGRIVWVEPSTGFVSAFVSSLSDVSAVNGDTGPGNEASIS